MPTSRTPTGPNNPADPIASSGRVGGVRRSVGGALLPLVAIGFPLAGVALGFAASLAPGAFLLSLLAFAGTAALVVALPRPNVALGLLVVTEVSNAGDVLARQGVPGVSTAVLLLGMATLVFGFRRGHVVLRWSPLYLVATLLWAALALSSLVAEDHGAALGTIVDIGRSLLFMLLVLALASSQEGIRTAVAAAVATVAVLGAISVVQEFALQNRVDFGGLSNIPKTADLGGTTARHSGPETDANFWGRSLVLFLPLSFSCFAATASRWSRSLWAVSSAAISGGLYLTQSRGALLAAIIAGTAWFLLPPRRYRRSLLLVPVVMAVAAMIPGVGSRLATLSEFTTQGDTAEASLVGRRDVQRLGIQMFLDHPATGVGIGNFRVAQPEYQRAYGVTEGLVDPRVLDAHNLYLEMAAEAGFGGLAAWVLFYATAIFMCLRGALRLRVSPGREERDFGDVFGRGAVCALLGWAVASIFLHLSNFRVLLVAVAVGGALDAVSRTTAGLVVDDRLKGLRREASQRGRRPRLPLLAGATTLVAVSLAGVMLTEDVWEARVDAVIETTAVDDPYAFDVATRRLSLQTFTDVAADERFREEAEETLLLTPAEERSVTTRVTRRPMSAVLVFAAQAPDRAVAEPLARATLDRAREYVTSLHSLYALRPVPAPPRLSRVSPPGSVQPALTRGLVCAGTVYLILVAAFRWRHRARRKPV